jgi:HAD superfamily hydrolase (TIGR01509 family)
VITPSFIYFDLDNTLVDHDAALKVALRQLCIRMPGWLSRKTFEEVHGEFERINLDLWEEYGAGRITPEILRRERSRRLACFCDPDGVDHPVDTITEEYVELYIASTTPVSGAIDTVALLSSRFPLGIISNGFSQWQRRKLMVAGLDRFFETIVLSEEVSSMKPDRQIFSTAARMVGCDPAEVLVVGDSYSVDIIGAAKAGMMSVWYNPLRRQLPLDVVDVAPDAVITSLRDLPPLLQSIPAT